MIKSKVKLKKIKGEGVIVSLVNFFSHQVLNLVDVPLAFRVESAIMQKKKKNDGSCTDNLA